GIVQDFNEDRVTVAFQDPVLVAHPEGQVTLLTVRERPKDLTFRRAGRSPRSQHTDALLQAALAEADDDVSGTGGKERKHLRPTHLLRGGRHQLVTAEVSHRSL